MIFNLIARYRALCITATLLLAASNANAQKVDLYALEKNIEYVGCVSACNHGSVNLVQSCLAQCPASDSAWELNGIAPIDEQDGYLAAVRYWDEGKNTYLCHRDRFVQDHWIDVIAIGDECKTADCPPQIPAAQCVDNDGDGLLAWKEELLHRSDSIADVACLDTSICGFAQTCEPQSIANLNLCTNRCAEGERCEAFSLEKVVDTTNELILLVHYNFSPVPATILDLEIDYDNNALTLIDARPLELLTAQNKDLSVVHMTARTFRLAVFNPNNLLPIPTGAIVELVFQRISSQPASVGFSHNSSARSHALAPYQGIGHSELLEDDLWSVDVRATENTKGLILSYNFDTREAPRDVPTPEALEATVNQLCTWSGTQCLKTINGRLTPDPVVLQRLRNVQQGASSTDASIAGVYGKAAYLDGVANHVELPVMLSGNAAKANTWNAQDFSVGLWFYVEDNARSTPQVIYSQNSGSERTQFGAVLKPHALCGDGNVGLVWFEGDALLYADPLQSPAQLAVALHEKLVSCAVSERHWHHFAFSLAAQMSQAQLYFDGVLSAVANMRNGQSFSATCPNIDNAGIVTMHLEGDKVLGASAPETIYMGVGENGLTGIVQVGANGLGRQKIVGGETFSASEPDYQPLSNKLVYSSNQSGNYEIWIANGDGSNARQVTFGFGDANRGIFARSPRWSQSGDAIVFESNVFDVSGDNNPGRGYQLYYTKVSDATELHYDAYLQRDAIKEIRLTGLEGEDEYNHVDAQFAQQTAAHEEVIVFNRSTTLSSDWSMRKLVVKQSAGSTFETPSTALFVDDVPVFGQQKRLLALGRRNLIVDGNAKPVDEVLYSMTSEFYQLQPNFSVVKSEGEDTIEVKIVYNGGLDPLTQIDNLYLEYNIDELVPDLRPEVSHIVDGLAKRASFAVQYPGSDPVVRIDVTSPYNETPMAAGTEIAIVTFQRLGMEAEPHLELIEHTTQQRFETRQVKSDNLPVDYSLATTEFVAPALFENVIAAQYSADGERVLLSGIHQGRPMLLVAKNNPVGVTVQDSEPLRIVEIAETVDGLSFKANERFYPCQWVGALRNPSDHAFLFGLQGGIDDLKMYNYVRTPYAFLSEAQRGHEVIVKANGEAPLDSRVASCSGTQDSACPAFHLCVDNACVLAPCDVHHPHCTDDYGRGECTLLPVALKAASGTEWACATECSNDYQCSKMQCEHGTCGFCSMPTGVCVECTEDAAGYAVGCPDRNSYECVAGACETECYSFSHGESTYLCDPASEYCERGRCHVAEWSWDDFYAVSLNGLADARTLKNIKADGNYFYESIDTLVPVEIEAYAQEDHGSAPVLRVTGMVGDMPVHLGDISIYTTTEAEARAHHYFVYTSWALTGLDLRMRVPRLPGAKIHSITNEIVDLPESLYVLGYPVGMSRIEKLRACNLRGDKSPACIAANRGDADLYMGMGRQTIIIKRVSVNDQSVALHSNWACSYENTTQPMDAGRRKKVFLGAPGAERSNEQIAFCSDPAHSVVCGDTTTELVNFKGAFSVGDALINCTYAKGDKIAGAMYQFAAPKVASTAGLMTETRSNCVVDGSGVEARPEGCYSYIGQDVSIDPLNTPALEIQGSTLDYDLFRFFANPCEVKPGMACPY